MATTIDETGFTRDRLDTILANVDAAMRAIYGQDIDLTPGSPDGQFDGILSEAMDTLGQLAEDTFLARSVAGARGASLSRLVKLIGITRNGASYSTADVVLSGTPGTVITAGSLVDTTDTPAAHFQTVADVTIDASGTVPGQVRATTTGPVFGDAGKITDIKTVISGWTAITNAAPVNLGSNMETDAALRIRRAASVALTGKSVIDSLYAALANIQGVSDAAVFENKTGSPISRPGAADLQPNAVQVVVRGGLDADIAAAIWAKASGGVTLVGTTSVGVIDAQGGTQAVRFDRPTPATMLADIYFTFPTPFVDLALVAAAKAALVGYGASTSRTGQLITWAKLFTPVVDGISAFTSTPSLNDIRIGTHRGGAPGLVPLDFGVGFNEYPFWDVSGMRIVATYNAGLIGYY